MTRKEAINEIRNWWYNLSSKEDMVVWLKKRNKSLKR